jgi:hypothetical protein
MVRLDLNHMEFCEQFAIDYAAAQKGEHRTDRTNLIQRTTRGKMAEIAFCLQKGLDWKLPEIWMIHPTRANHDFLVDGRVYEVKACSPQEMDLGGLWLVNRHSHWAELVSFWVASVNSRICIPALEIPGLYLQDHYGLLESPRDFSDHPGSVSSRKLAFNANSLGRLQKFLVDKQRLG